MRCASIFAHGVSEKTAKGEALSRHSDAQCRGSTRRDRDLHHRRSIAVIARRFVDGIIAKCDALEYYPSRGTPRGDLGIGLHTVPYRRRTTILYSVEDDMVAILGIFYGGRDWESWVRTDQ